MMRVRSIVASVLTRLAELANEPATSRRSRRTTRGASFNVRDSFNVRPSVEVRSPVDDGTPQQIGCLLAVLWEVVESPPPGQEHPETKLYPGEGERVTTEALAVLYSVPPNVSWYECAEPTRDGEGVAVHVVSVIRVRIIGDKSATTARLRKVSVGNSWAASPRGSDRYSVDVPQSVRYESGRLLCSLDWPIVE
jgi:hypothetical protein